MDRKVSPSKPLPHTHSYSEITGKPTFGTAAGLDAGVPSGVAQLDGSGKVPSSQLPPLAITDTFVVGSQAEMLDLSAQTGDVCVRTDLSKSFILASNAPSVLGSWQELQSPPNNVQSVFGRTGNITSQSGDYSASQISGLGDSATKNVGSTAGTVAAGNDSRFTAKKNLVTDTEGVVGTGFLQLINGAVQSSASKVDLGSASHSMGLFGTGFVKAAGGVLNPNSGTVNLTSVDDVSGLSGSGLVRGNGSGGLSGSTGPVNLSSEVTGNLPLGNHNPALVGASYMIDDGSVRTFDLLSAAAQSFHVVFDGVMIMVNSWSIPQGVSVTSSLYLTGAGPGNISAIYGIDKWIGSAPTFPITPGSDTYVLVATTYDVYSGGMVVKKVVGSLQKLA